VTGAIQFLISAIVYSQKQTILTGVRKLISKNLFIRVVIVVGGGGDEEDGGQPHERGARAPQSSEYKSQTIYL
jgi:hypothetical protein